MFQFSILSSVIPYIALVVAYLFYLGACAFSKKDISIDDEGIAKVISVDNNSSFETNDTYDLSFNLTCEVQDAHTPKLSLPKENTLKLDLPPIVYRLKPNKSTITTRPPPVV